MRTLRNYEKQQEIDMAEIDAMKDLLLVETLAELIADRLIDSPSPRVNLLGADLSIICQKARNLRNDIRWESLGNC